MVGQQIEPYLVTFLHSMGAKKGTPVGGTFELTARCNFSCPMCYVHQKGCETAQRELSAAQWIDLARQARDRGMVFALLTGGEPFIRKDFFEIYNTMKAMGLLISINSNGSMLTGDIRRQLLENPPQRINISLYGGCRETYLNMCGRDAFDQVLENIRELKAGGVDVQLNLSITPYNRQDLEKIHEISRELNVHVKASSYMYPPVRLNDGKTDAKHRLTAREAAQCGVEWDLLRFTPEQFAQRARSMRQLSRVENSGCSADPEAGVSCRAGSSSFWLTWDGKMLPCGLMPGPAENVLEVGFEEAWNRIRKAVAQIRTPKECVSCPKRELCPVCAAVCISETGAFDRVPTYVCDQTDQMIRATWDAFEERSGN